MKLKCNKCNDIIEGDGKGTYISCKCGAIAIDETEYYTRIIGNKEDIKEISAIENLKEYIEKDALYQKYKLGVFPDSDFDEFCINHCKDIETLIYKYERLLESNKRLEQDVENLNTLIKEDNRCERAEEFIKALRCFNEISEEHANYIIDVLKGNR